MPAQPHDGQRITENINSTKSQDKLMDWRRKVNPVTPLSLSAFLKKDPWAARTECRALPFGQKVGVRHE
jgi:hypothetical protein